MSDFYVIIKLLEIIIAFFTCTFLGDEMKNEKNNFFVWFLFFGLIKLSKYS